MPANEKATMLKGPFSSDKVKRDGSIPVMYNEIPLLSRPGMSGFFVFRHSRCESLSRVGRYFRVGDRTTYGVCPIITIDPLGN